MTTANNLLKNVQIDTFRQNRSILDGGGGSGSPSSSAQLRACFLYHNIQNLSFLENNFENIE